MSRTKKDILETESMLRRLERVLGDACGLTADSGQIIEDAEALRRISITIRRWFELECGDSNAYGSWAIVRGDWAKVPERRGEFVHDDDGKAFMERHEYRWSCDGTTGKQVNTITTVHTPIPDREAGARKRLAKILSRYPGFTAYVQTDPRGCALYILKPGDVREGADVSSCYTNGIAVYR